MDGTSDRVFDDVGDDVVRYWSSSSDDVISTDESSCSTVVNDSVDSDSTPSPFLLGGLQYLKRSETGRPFESEYDGIQSDGSDSTACSESILNPTNRLKDLSIKETDTTNACKQSEQQFSTNTASPREQSPIISIVCHPSSAHEQNKNGRLGQINDGNTAVVNDFTMGSAQAMDRDFLTPMMHSVQNYHQIPASDSSNGQRLLDTHDALSPELSDSCKSPVRNVESRQIAVPSVYSPDASNLNHDAYTFATDVPALSHSFKDSSERNDPVALIDNSNHQSSPSPIKLRKLSVGSERGLSDSLEDVTQVDGSACMFSDSSPVKSLSDHLLLPSSLAGDADEKNITRKEGESPTSEITLLNYATGKRSKANDEPFVESQITNFPTLENYCKLATNAPLPTYYVNGHRSSNSAMYPDPQIVEDDSTCGVDTNRVNAKGNRSADGTTMAKPGQERKSCLNTEKIDGNESIVEGNLEDLNQEGYTDETLRPTRKTTRGHGKLGNKPSQRGKGRKRQVTKRAEECSGGVVENQDEGTGRWVRSQRENAGIHRNDIMIRERIVALQKKFADIDSIQTKLMLSLSKPYDVIKDVITDGQRLSNIQTNLRLIATEVKQLKTDLDHTLFDLRYVHSQKKRKAYAKQQLEIVRDLQQTLWAQLKVHRGVVARLQEIIRSHTEGRREMRRNNASQATEKKTNWEELAELTQSGKSSGNSSESGRLTQSGHGVENLSGKVSDIVNEYSSKEESTAERQQSLIEQLIGTLDECEGNLLAKFMSVLQDRGPQQNLTRNFTGEPNKKDINTESKETGSIQLGSVSDDNQMACDRSTLRKINEAEEVTSAVEDQSHSKKSEAPSLTSMTSNKMLPEDKCSSPESEDGDVGEFLSSSDEEMSVVPPFHDMPKAHHPCKSFQKAASPCEIEKQAQEGEVVPEVFLEDVTVREERIDVQETVTRKSKVGNAANFSSVRPSKKNEPTTTSHFHNSVAFPLQKPSSFHTPWKGLTSQSQGVKSAGILQTPPVDTFRAVLPCSVSSGIYSAAAHNTTMCLPRTPDSLQCHQGLIKIGPALGICSNEEENPSICTSVSNSKSRMSSNYEDTIHCGVRNGLKVQDSPFGCSAQRDGPTQRSQQVPCLPDMKLYKKIHLVDDRELIPYTDIVPREIWIAEDISNVEMPEDFVSEIDAW